MNIENLHNFREHLTEVTEQNVYLRRFLKRRPAPNKEEIRRAFMLATQREISEAMGYLWRTEREFSKMHVVIHECSEAVHHVLDVMKRFPHEAVPVTDAEMAENCAKLGYLPGSFEE